MEFNDVSSPENSRQSKDTGILESHEGIIERIVFHNPDNGYTVASFARLDEKGRFTIVGVVPGANEGLPVNIEGRWIVHPRFGNQFSIEKCEANLPRSKMGVVKYLTSFIKGVGPVMAKRIVDKFGEETADIIEKTPKRLREVEGIGKQKADQIEKSWNEHLRIKSIMMFLQSHNISPGVAMKIFNTYGENSVVILNQNPYLLATDIFGIGFKTADRIAMNLGMEKDSEVRLEAGIIYTLEMAAGEGHVYLPSEVLIESSSKLLEAADSKIEVILKRLIGEDDRIVEEEGRVYIHTYYRAERTIAERLSIIMKQPSSNIFDMNSESRAIRSAEKALGFKLSDQQLSVIDVLVKQKAVILTGGPGTGKTVSTRAAIYVFKKSGYRVLLAAPTGRAAKRMTEATGFPSKTIHRLLEFNPIMRVFGRNEENPLECDMLVIDEMSMVDTILMQRLVAAIKADTKILFVGDVDQLPSVGPGNVLRDLISSGVIPTIVLDVVYRQDSESSIVSNAHLINKGNMPVMAKDRNGNFFFSSKEDPEEALETVVRLCSERLPARFRLRPLKDIQVISPMYRGVLGVDNLNKVLQANLNPGKDLVCGSRKFRIGDRVMQIKNNYDKEVYNGDVGFVRTVDLQNGKIIIEYPDHMVEYDFSETDQLVLAYAITVHKSQGSEYPVVVMPVSTHHFVMLQRNLLYTALTRAEKLVVLVGSRKAVAIAVKNNKIEDRFTSLDERLVQETGNKHLFDR